MPKTLNDIEIVLNRTIREYEEFRTQQLELVPIITPEWTDFYSSDGGVTLLELNSAVADMLSYYVDRALNEAHPNTAQLKRSIYNHTTYTGYTPSLKSSATVSVDVTVSGAGTLYGINSVTEEPLRIESSTGPSGTRVSFELMEEFTAPSSGTYNLVFIEGKTISNEVLGSSNGDVGQSFLLGQDNVTYNLDGTASLKVEVKELETWSTWINVSNFSESTSVDPHYTLDFSPRDIFQITFGDGNNGKKPNFGSNNIRATYRVGGGIEANFIPIGGINRVSFDSSGLVSSVSNTVTPSGGSEEETLEQIKTNSANYFATQNRAVTYKDIEALAVAIPGVWKAKAGPVDDNPLNVGVWVAVEGTNPVPTGEWNPNTEIGFGLLGAVGNNIKNKKMAVVKLFILPTTAVGINVGLSVNIKDDYYKNEIYEKTLESVEDYILSSNRSTSESIISLSGLNKVIEDIVGVRYVDVNYFYREAFIKETQVGITDTSYSGVTVSNNISDQTWSVFFTSSTSFQVTGSNSGLQNNVGRINETYSTDKGELTFQFNSGSIPNQFGDQYSVLTSDYAGNIHILDEETPVVLANSISIDIVGGI